LLRCDHAATLGALTLIASDEGVSPLSLFVCDHRYFSQRDVIVPEHVKDATTLSDSIDRWATTVIDASFHPPDGDDVRQPIYINGKKLVSSIALVHKVALNGKKRILNCIPPRGMDAWVATDKLDPNLFVIWKPVFHTCGVESLNAAQVRVFAHWPFLACPSLMPPLRPSLAPPLPHQ
jgi:hypothetical protein